MTFISFRSARRMVLFVALTGGLSACASVNLSEAYDGEQLATVGLMTAQNRALREVPEGHKPIRVAVYGMPDLTGQYKESVNGQSLSRAVTQGGSAVLIKSLMDAGERSWFTVLDRSNLDNLLRERQIITEMRRIYRNENSVNPRILPPLDNAGIILEGAIVGYDTNLATGGVGARYLGIGANQRWKLDVITVSLRAVSTESSEVLAAVTVRKPIASTVRQASVFSYVALDELLEGELGTSINEPKQIALEQAVEKAVMALIAEGARLKIWKFENAGAGRAFVAGYTQQKYDGDIPTGALALRLPRTTSTDIPRTIPIQTSARIPAAVQERQLPPAANSQGAPTLPSDLPDSQEIVG